MATKNYTLSSKQIDDMKHCIGFSRERVTGKKNPKYSAYRNYFTTSDNNPEWDSLVSQELAIVQDHTHGIGKNPKVYFVSKEGLAALGEILEVEITETE